MTKFEELEHLKYAIDLVGKLPYQLPVSTLYKYLESRREDVTESITVLEHFLNFTKGINLR